MFEELAYRVGRSTLVLLTLGRVRPPRTRQSERWLGALGTVELITLLLGGFVYYLYQV
ncbi:MAG: hypothetical protein ABWY06_14465 [Pseudomonas sp.]|uniref:hypothetical protein n=1 Tax=Pseudomonas sp. TaxID=306 RepID=UPI00339366CF